MFSPDRVYRYGLKRRWGPGKLVLFVGLNPSTADETTDDATIRRCVGFARRWGFPGLYMANLYAYRSTDPRGLREVEDPVGPVNDLWLELLAGVAAKTVVAWGAYAYADRRARVALGILGETYALGRTTGGHPCHPLRLPNDRELERFS